MIVTGAGRAPAYRHVVELAGEYGVAEKEVEVILDEVAAAVERWSEFAQAAGVRGAVSANISRQFDAIRLE
ncbi:MAG: hypothetical protein Q3M24_02500 [Candidatus Electrothrix aestuarii]|uniref:Uncharacterized protein n=1 Tax=Candidatus Electrothrix aestuarii TaxID=3062594 RepID=A0AAU8LWI6_9BACT|nr:hypothetical protein [Candidatus Electrothrix aestuarii]